MENVYHCQTPANPSEILIGCKNRVCSKWLHYECLLEDILKRIYKQLGTDKPHVSHEHSFNMKSAIVRLSDCSAFSDERASATNAPHLGSGSLAWTEKRKEDHNSRKPYEGSKA